MKGRARILFGAVVVLAVGGAVAYVYFLRGGDGSLGLAPRQELSLPIEGHPLPAVDVELDREEILNVLPPKAVSLSVQPVPRIDRPERPKSAQDFLEKVTSRWVYTEYVNLGGVSIGTFRYNDKPKDREGLELREGDVHEGVTIFYLDNSKAMARYGSATIKMPLVNARPASISEFPHLVFADNVPDPTAAWAYYWEWFGKLNKERAKDFVPAPGERFPPAEPLNKEQVKERIDGYLEFMAQRMQERKPHPRYEDSDFSVEDMRRQMYQKYNIEQVEDSPTEKTPRSSDGVIHIGESPGEGG